MAFRRWLAILLLATAPTLAIGQDKVSIAMTPSLLVDQSEAQQKFIADEFPNLVKDFTGLAGTLDRPKTADDVAERVASGKSTFGVLQGIEFAEAKEKHPGIEALIIALYRTPANKAIVLTKKDASAASFADLKGKDVAVLKQGKEHIRRYLKKATGEDSAAFFGKVIDMPNAESSLDSLLLGKAFAAVVDDATLSQYKEVNPGRYNRLKIIAESETFPPSVIFYNPKMADAKIVDQFRAGMLKAGESTASREVMGTFRITSFEPIPKDLSESLAAIRKAYP